MKRRPICGLLLCALLLLAPSTVKAQTPTEAKSDDKIKLPTGSVLVVVDELKNLIRPDSKLIVLTPEKYKELTSQLEQLKQQVTSDKKRPHSCKLVGKIEGSAVQFRTQFLFTTETANTTVYLGLEGGFLTDPGELDGELPPIDVVGGGLVVRVGKPGLHQVTLNVKAPLGARRAAGTPGGVERFLDLGLPEAAVTTLDLELPEAVKEIRSGDGVEKPTTPGHWNLALGKAKQLKLAWKESMSITGADAYTTADSQVVVTLEETQAITTAELTLYDHRARVKEWRVFLPIQAKVDLKSPAEIGYELVRPSAKDQPFVLKLREPTTEPLVLEMESRHPRPFVPARLSVGPFLVVGAVHQQASIAVKASANALKGQRLVFHRGVETFQRELPSPAPPDMVARFQYWGQPGPAKVVKAPLELELKAEKGKIDGFAEHNLRVHRFPDRWQVDVTSKIRIKSLPPGTDFIDVQLPRAKFESLLFVFALGTPAFPGDLPLGAFCQSVAKVWPFAAPEFFCDTEPGGPSAELQPPDAMRRARIKLGRVPDKEFSLILTGKYIMPADSAHAAVDVPRLLDAHRAKVTVQLDDQHQLLGAFAEAEELVGEKHVYTTNWDQLPASLALAWKSYRRPYTVIGQADVTFTTDEIRVRQEIALPPPSKATASPSLRLRVPAEIEELTIITGGKKRVYEPEGGLISVSSLDPKLVFEYRLTAAKEKDSPTLLPLVWPENATRIEAIARLWTGPELTPYAADQGWRETLNVPAPGRDSLPALTLQRVGPAEPLFVRLKHSASMLLARAVIERELAQVILGEDGSQYYRSRFLLRKVSTPHLTLELPATATGVSIHVNQLRINNVEVSQGNPAYAKIKLDPDAGPLMLAIDYKVPASASGWWQRLEPPGFGNDVSIAESRWQILHTPACVPLIFDGTIRLDHKWAFQGGLLAPAPAVSAADLNTWIAGKDDFDARQASFIAFRRSSSLPVEILLAPRQAWLLLCSSILLGLGLLLSHVHMSRLTVFVTCVGVVLFLLIVSVVWPAIMPFLAYGCQPGAVVLVIVLGIQWFLREKYRRQLVFLPGFTRVAMGSSLIRARSVEGTTIDAPPPAPAPGSSSSSKKTSV